MIIPEGVSENDAFKILKKNYEFMNGQTPNKKIKYLIITHCDNKNEDRRRGKNTVVLALKTNEEGKEKLYSLGKVRGLKITNTKIDVIPIDKNITLISPSEGEFEDNWNYTNEILEVNNKKII